MFTTHPSTFLRKLFVLPYILLVIVGLTIPSDGSHGFLSIKSLSFVTSVLSVMMFVTIEKKLTMRQWKILCFMMLSLLFLLLWLFIGILYGETPEHSSWEQFKIIWLTITVVAISIYFVHEQLISFSALLKTVLLTNFTYSIVKVTLVLLHIFGYVNLWSIVDALGVRFMSMDILGTLPRFQTSIDIVTPFLLLFFLQSKNFDITWSKTFRVIYLTVTLFAIFLSFSRFLTLIAFLSLFLHAFTLKASSIIRLTPLVFIACFSLVAWLGIDNIYLIIERRFLSADNFNSDFGRHAQIAGLMQEYANYPILGKGLGSYAPQIIRDPQLLYSYEVQWVAALMQFGIIGLTLLLIPLFIIGIKILSKPITKTKIAFFILFLSWLASGFTNPFLLSLTSGIVYSLFYLTGEELKKETRQLNPLHPNAPLAI